MDPKYKEHILRKYYDNPEKSPEEIALEDSHDIYKTDYTTNEINAKRALRMFYSKVMDIWEHWEIKGKMSHSLVVEKHLLESTIESRNFKDLRKMMKRVIKSLDTVRTEREEKET